MNVLVGDHGNLDPVEIESKFPARQSLDDRGFHFRKSAAGSDEEEKADPFPYQSTCEEVIAAQARSDSGRFSLRYVGLSSDDIHSAGESTTLKRSAFIDPKRCLI